MMWGILTNDYKFNKGYGGNISRMVASSRGFNAHLMGYAESHDENVYV
jgi:hypothetical protein